MKAVFPVVAVLFAGATLLGSSGSGAVVPSETVGQCILAYDACLHSGNSRDACLTELQICEGSVGRTSNGTQWLNKENH